MAMTKKHCIYTI